MPQDDWQDADDWATPGSASAKPSQTYVSSMPQQTGLLRYPAMVGSEALKGLLAAMGTPGDLAAKLPNFGSHPVDPALLATNPMDPITGFGNSAPISLPTSTQLLELGGRLGLIDRANLTPGYGPAPEAERLLAAGSRGVGSALPSALLTGSPLLSLAYGGSGGVAGEAAHELLPQSQMAPLLAGLVAGGGVNAVKSIATKPNLANEVAGLGSSQTLDDAGHVLQSAAHDWRDNVMPQREAERWSTLDSSIPSDARFPLPNFGSALSGANNTSQTLQGVMDAAGGTKLKQLQSAFDKSEASDAGAPWSDMRALRTQIGQMQANPMMLRDIGESKLAAIYSGISKDMESAAGAWGQDDAFAAANAGSKADHDFMRGPLRQLISTTDESTDKPAGAVASSLISGARKSGDTLNTLRSEMPDAVDELAAAHLTQTPQGWQKLSPEGQAALVPDEGQRQRINDAVEAALAAKPNTLTKLQHVVSTGAGAALGELGLHIAGGGSPMTSLLVGLGGAAAPYALGAGKNFVRSPLALTQGAVAGNTANYDRP